MSVVDILIAIIVVTILVTIVLGVVTYLAYKLRLARKPSGRFSGSPETRYFVLQEPPARASEETDSVPSASPDQIFGPGALAARSALESEGVHAT